MIENMNPKTIKILFIVLASMFALPIIIFLAIKNPTIVMVIVVLGAVLLLSLAESKGWL